MVASILFEGIYIFSHIFINLLLILTRVPAPKAHTKLSMFTYVYLVRERWDVKYMLFNIIHIVHVFFKIIEQIFKTSQELFCLHWMFSEVAFEYTI